MDVVDELMTPGCPNCAVKHLCAALERMVDGINVPGDGPESKADTLLARAYINFVEAKEGYRSHFDFAVGLMVAAEESLVRSGNDAYALEVRNVRLGMVERGDMLTELFVMCTGRLSRAHFEEAMRELPELSANFDPIYPEYGQAGADKILAMIAWIKNEYFRTEEKGEDTMAINKKAAAKKAPFAKQAAAKGGCCKAGKKSCKK